MTTPLFGFPTWRTALRRLLIVSVLFGAQALPAAEATKRFNLAPDFAERSLKRFAQQSGLEVVFASEVADGVRVNEVRGEFTPTEAGRRLLAGTPLTLVRDERTGVYSVTRAAPAASPAPPTGSGKNVDSRPAIISDAGAGQPTGDIDSTVVLSEFRVDASKDVGYRATNTVTGTLLNTAMKDVPFAIDVFNRDFIEDIAASDFRQVLEYDSGVQLYNTLTSGSGVQREDNLNRIENQDSETQVRGFTVPALENGFFTDYRVDTVKIARLERAGGPNSLLYGIGALSGVPNIITRLPEFRNSARVDLTVGSADFQRGQLHVERNLLPMSSSQRLAVALFGAAETRSRLNGNVEIDDSEIRNFYVSPVVRWRPFRNTDVKLDYSYSKRDNIGNGQTDVDDTTLPQLIYRETQKIGRDVLGLGRGVNISGENAFTEEVASRLHAEVLQRVGDHVSLMFQYQRDEYESSGRRSTVELVNAAQVPANVDASQRGPDGRALRSFWWPTTGIDRESDQVRASGLLRYTLMPDNRFFGGEQKLVAGVQHAQRLQVSNDQSNALTGRNVWYRSWEDFSTLPFDGQTVSNPFRDQYRYRWLTGGYAIYQGSFWGGRIMPTAGIRRERYHSRGIEYRYTNGVRNENYQTILPANRQLASPSGYSNKGEPVVSDNPMFGLSLRVTPEINVYVVRAEGIAIPNETQTNGYGEQFPAREMKNLEAGIKFDLLEGRISGRLAIFEGEQYNNVRYIFYGVGTGRNVQFDPAQPVAWNLPSGVYFYDNPEHRAYLQSLHQQASAALAAGQPLPAGDVNTLLFPSGTRTANNNNPNMSRGAYVSTDDETFGYEASVDLNITRNFTGKLSYTYNDVTILNGVSGIVDPTALTGLDTVLAYLGPENFADTMRPSTYNGAAQRGAKLNDTPKHSMSVFMRYQFTTGALRNANVRFGVRYAGERVAQGIDASFDRIGGVAGAPAPAQRPRVPETLLFDAGVGYRMRLFEQDVRFDLFVRNLMDDQKVEAFNTAGGTRLFVESRDIRFTASVLF